MRALCTRGDPALPCVDLQVGASGVVTLDLLPACIAIVDVRNLYTHGDPALCRPAGGGRQRGHHGPAARLLGTCSICICQIRQTLPCVDLQVGAGSVVTMDLPPACVAVGVPARIIKTNNRPPTDMDQCDDYIHDYVI